MYRQPVADRKDELLADSKDEVQEDVLAPMAACSLDVVVDVRGRGVLVDGVLVFALLGPKPQVGGCVLLVVDVAATHRKVGARVVAVLGVATAVYFVE